MDCHYWKKYLTIKLFGLVWGSLVGLWCMWHSTKHNAATQRKSRKSISIMGQRNAHLPPCSFHNTSILCKNSMMMHHIGSPMYLPPFLDKEIILLTQKILKNYTLTPIIQCVPKLLGHIVSALGTSPCTKGLFCNFFQGRRKAACSISFRWPQVIPS